MTPYEIVDRKLREGMVEGQMHGCLRDIGRLAGGYAAAGSLSTRDLDELQRLAVSLSKTKTKGERTWREGVEFGRSQPVEPSVTTARRDTADTPLTWDSVIGPGMVGDAVYGADYAEPIPPPAMAHVDELVAYLEILFEPEDRVSYVLQSFKDEDGKHKPMGKGVYGRTRSDIVTDLRRYQSKGMPDLEAIENALGTWDTDAGGWIRLNPMTGAGVTNEDVSSLRHVLVESDSMPLERQLATIQSMRLPCTAIVHSGGKSVHAIVRVDAGTDRAVYRERVESLFKRLDDAGFPVDRQCRNPSRLSRLPGLTRGDRRQYLVSGPCGASNWDEWESSTRADEYSAEILAPDEIDSDLPDDNLLGNRFLTRGGTWLLVAQSGIGKSVFALQGAVSFAVGRDLFGLKAAKPLRQLIVQAENNALDVQETYRGVCDGLKLTDAERRLLRENLRVVQADRHTGADFARFLDWLCRRVKPDVVWIDPLLAYIGGEISRMADCAKFLRNGLNPVIHDHGIGVVVVHHTGKPPKGDDAKLAGADMAYLGIGSSDLTNWARATSTIVRCDDCDNRYALQHAKRGGRAGCEAVQDVMHAASGICWVKATGTRPDNAKGQHRGKDAHKTDPSEKMNRSDYRNHGFENMPELRIDKDHEKSDLHRWIAAVMDERGNPIDTRRAESIRSAIAKAGFIVHDSETKLWRGVCYDPSFA